MNFQENIELISSGTSARWTEATMVKPSLSTPLHHSLDPKAIDPKALEPNVYQPIDATLQSVEASLIRAIQSSDTPKNGLLQVTTLLGEAFRVNGCMIGLLDRDQIMTQSTCWSASGSAAFLAHPTDVLDILSHLVAKPERMSSEVVAIADIFSSPETDTLKSQLKAAASPHHLGLAPSIQAVLAIPTVAQGHVNGLIVLTRSQPHTWTQQEMQHLQALSSSVSIAISHMQLDQQVKQQISSQELMSQLTTAIRGSCDLEQIFQSAIAGLVSTLSITRGFVLLFKYSDPLFKKRGTDLTPKAKVTVECQYPLACDPVIADVQQEIADFENSSGTWLKRSFALSDCRFCQQIFTQTSPIVAISNYPYSTTGSQPSQTTAMGAGRSPIFNLDKMPSLLLVPLENQGTVLGCLALQSDRRHGWQQEERSVVTLIAAQLSTAIIQSRALRQVQSLVEERTAQLQRSLDVQAKLYEKTRQQVDQLRQLNHIMEEFLSTMSHELLTPLTSMTLAIRMLRQAKLSPEQQQRYLDILERQCAQETNLINDLLALQQLESGATIPRFQPLDVRYLIRDVVQTLDEICTKKRLTLDLDLPARPLQIRTDLDSLNRILTELLTNAGKYADSDTTIRLEMSYQIENQVGCVVLKISNVGAGIMAEEMPYIFDKFRRGQGVTQQAIPGTGLGLALVKGLVEHLNGTITASSVPLAESSSWETCFTLTLPQSPDR
jgi:signal transduction histidine kinase